MFWARLPMIVVGALLGVLLYLPGRRLLGEAAALGAVFLYAIDPNVIAHSYPVTMSIAPPNSVAALRNRAVRLKQSRDRKYL